MAAVVLPPDPNVEGKQDTLVLPDICLLPFSKLQIKGGDYATGIAYLHKAGKPGRVFFALLEDPEITPTLWKVMATVRLPQSDECSHGVDLVVGQVPGHKVYGDNFFMRAEEGVYVVDTTSLRRVEVAKLVDLETERARLQAENDAKWFSVIELMDKRAAVLLALKGYQPVLCEKGTKQA